MFRDRKTRVPVPRDQHEIQEIPRVAWDWYSGLAIAKHVRVRRTLTLGAPLRGDVEATFVECPA